MNPIVRLAATALPGDKKFILFAGAGLSKDSGIPTSWDLMLKTAGLLYASETQEVDAKIDLQQWFLASKYSHMAYSDLIDQIYPKHTEQQQFLAEYLSAHKAGEAHLLVAELARRGIIRAIVTTNFDHCLEKALEEKGVESQPISTDEDLQHSEPLIHCRAVRIYKPHGTLGRGALRNTPKDLDALSTAMHKELVQVLSEHGVIILGYSGQDKGIQRVLDERNSNFYPLFWVDPHMPSGEAKAIMERKEYTYIQCEGASQFIRDFLKLIDRLDALAPKTGRGPTVPDLQYEIKNAQQPITPFYQEFLASLLADIEATRPDFTKFAEYDDAIVSQIVSLVPMTYRFLEASVIAAKAQNSDALKSLYRFFGDVRKLYDVPEGFAGTFRRADFDGFKFVGYEMFVGLIASIIRYDQWALLGELLDEDLFVDKTQDGRYESFVRVSAYVASLDEIRNKRLNLNRVSVMADMLKERFTKSELSELVTHKEFLEADYFLFMRTVCHQDDVKYLQNVWCPRSTVWLDRTPGYIVRAESARYLNRMLPATGFAKSEEFISNLKAKHVAFEQYFRSGIVDSPLRFVNLDSLGTRK
jgi:hypothetical protein